jgi:hypothetical protein
VILDISGIERTERKKQYKEQYYKNKVGENEPVPCFKLPLGSSIIDATQDKTIPGKYKPADRTAYRQFIIPSQIEIGFRIVVKIIDRHQQCYKGDPKKK